MINVDPKLEKISNIFGYTSKTHKIYWFWHEGYVGWRVMSSNIEKTALQLEQIKKGNA
jgi:hypothetical protein